MKIEDKIRNNKIIIMRSAGFVGTTLAKRLVVKNEIVLSNNFHRNALRNTDLEKYSNIKVIKGDVLEYAELKLSIKGAD